MSITHKWSQKPILICELHMTDKNQKIYTYEN
jgi:hypothetical protein